MNASSPSLADIRAAAQRIRPYAHRTPVLTSSSLDRLLGAHVFLKCENLQKIGAFKFRGACNAVFSLGDEEAARGIATHSSGNHAQAIALAARLRGTRAYVVMPVTSSRVKKAAVEGYGAAITFCEPDLESRESALARVIQETGATMIHPFNDHRVIAGQGTAALELMEEVAHLDVVMAPVGGGGLLSGTALAAKGLNPALRVIGAEPELADDAYQSLHSGRIMPARPPRTVADGLLTSLGDLTFPIIRQHVDAIVTVSEEAIIEATHYIWERVKIIIEPSSAVPVAALMQQKFDFSGQRVGVILSGGNVDLHHLPWNSE